MTHPEPPEDEPGTIAENKPDVCPHCGASLLGEPIPEESRYAYGGSTRFRREFLVEVRGVRDGGLYYACPDCGRAWPRWRGTHAAVTLSERYAAKRNAALDEEAPGE